MVATDWDAGVGYKITYLDLTRREIDRYGHMVPHFMTKLIEVKI